MIDVDGRTVNRMVLDEVESTRLNLGEGSANAETRSARVQHFGTRGEGDFVVLLSLQLCIAPQTPEFGASATPLDFALDRSLFIGNVRQL